MWIIHHQCSIMPQISLLLAKCTMPGYFKYWKGAEIYRGQIVIFMILASWAHDLNVVAFLHSPGYPGHLITLLAWIQRDAAATRYCIIHRFQMNVVKSSYLPYRFYCTRWRCPWIWSRNGVTWYTRQESPILRDCLDHTQLDIRDDNR